MEDQSQAINELALALSKTQGLLKPIFKDNAVSFDSKSANSKIKYKYADLADVLDSCRETLSQHELAVMQTMKNLDNNLTLVTTLAHSSGQWIKSFLPLIKTDNPQALGSSITYMRRYALCAILSIAPEDDDGREAMIESAKSNYETIEKKMLDFLTKYPEEDHLPIRAYLQKYCDYWKKDMIKTLSEYDKDVFENDFNKWKKKQLEKNTNSE